MAGIELYRFIKEPEGGSELELPSLADRPFESSRLPLTTSINTYTIPSYAGNNSRNRLKNVKSQEKPSKITGSERISTAYNEEMDYAPSYWSLSTANIIPQDYGYDFVTFLWETILCVDFLGTNSKEFSPVASHCKVLLARSRSPPLKKELKLQC